MSRELTIRNRGYLPHWEAPGASYSVTFRLTDSLPQEILAAYVREREGIIATAAQMNRPLSWQERARLDELFSERIEYYLDQGVGECLLRKQEIGDLVMSSLRHFDGSRYNLFACCVMPNHVHILFRPAPALGLDEILHSWKSYTATMANRLLQRRGMFWMPEYYDHLIRDAEDLAHHRQYILNNPRKAGLDEWSWILEVPNRI